MIHHVGLEVSDLRRSAAFYDAVLFALGVRRMHESASAIAYGVNDPVFWIVTRRSRAPQPGFGHVAFAASGRAAVDAAYAAGLASGGRSDGDPGNREQYARGRYAAYLQDPAGLRVEVAAGPR